MEQIFQDYLYNALAQKAKQEKLKAQQQAQQQAIASALGAARSRKQYGAPAYYPYDYYTQSGAHPLSFNPLGQGYPGAVLQQRQPISRERAAPRESFDSPYVIYPSNYDPEQTSGDANNEEEEEDDEDEGENPSGNEDVQQALLNYLKSKGLEVRSEQPKSKNSNVQYRNLDDLYNPYVSSRLPDTKYAARPTGSLPFGYMGSPLGYQVHPQHLPVAYDRYNGAEDDGYYYDNAQDEEDYGDESRNGYYGQESNSHNDLIKQLLKQAISKQEASASTKADDKESKITSEDKPISLGDEVTDAAENEEENEKEEKTEQEKEKEIPEIQGKDILEALFGAAPRTSGAVPPPSFTRKSSISKAPLAKRRSTFGTTHSSSYTGGQPLKIHKDDESSLRSGDDKIDSLQISAPQIKSNLPFSPAINVYDFKEQYIIVVSLPGCESTSFDIDYHPISNEIVIKGSLSNKYLDETTLNPEILKVSEQRFGAFERMIKLPSFPEIKDNDIKAKYANGLLEVKIPKDLDEKKVKKAPKKIIIEDIPDEELERESKDLI
ncbi:unnamed protein product [[Candida] boidinii]|uniref:Unnamed protein product n=1 Tax=Candida boidinii TaxID=5477 RepID=A0A9W6SYI6_CANBO|nr:hypothetical protein BVG19_g2202 [[Candida] boidinii]OWB50723.1 hypothetical protein B5S27_g2275 [[Candida] boidinii]OWB65288.1 hypothetical protein B5S30_g612 [[Candida] boidinii]OWB82998.1 hypothetical protein B5S33_g1627 [[Candida] boidinii]GME67486.1 unnamed protein product [[Candida] boidinii]